MPRLSAQIHTKSGTPTPLKLVRGIYPIAESAMPEGPGRSHPDGHGPTSAKSTLAIKGEASPVMSYDSHDPHFPFGRPVAIDIPVRSADSESTDVPDRSLPARSVKMVLPEAAVWVIDGLLATLASREVRIAALEAELARDRPAAPMAEAPLAENAALRPVPERLLPLIQSILSRRTSVTRLQAGSALAVAATPEPRADHQSEHRTELQVEVKFALAIPEAIACTIDAASEDAATLVLQALMVAEFRAGRLSFGELRRLLGLKSRSAAIDFLTTHDVPLAELTDNF